MYRLKSKASAELTKQVDELKTKLDAATAAAAKIPAATSPSDMR